MEKTYIYGLKEKNGEIRYVGKANDPKRRFRQHKNNARKETSHKVSWINNCIINDIEIEMVILEEVNNNEWQDREIYWINKFTNLTNHDKGGKGGKPIKYKLSYDNCKKWVQENLPNIKSISQWEKNKLNLPDFISPYPKDTYLYRGWVSWADFLGSNNVASNKQIFLSYNEAKIYLKNNHPEIKNSIQYRKAKLPNFLHKKPKIYYKNIWIDWNNYLDTNNCKRFNFITYDEFKIWINLNYPEYKSNAKFNQIKDKLPPFIPKKPSGAYKDKGWLGWCKL
jgi:hypothetical protein